MTAPQEKGSDLRFMVAECTRTERFKAFVISPTSMVGTHSWGESPRDAVELLAAMLGRAVADGIARSVTLDDIRSAQAIWTDWAATSGEVVLRREYPGGDGRHAVDVRWCPKTSRYRAALVDVVTPSNDWRAIVGEGVGTTPEAAVEALFDYMASSLSEATPPSELPQLLAQMRVIKDGWRAEPRPWHAFGRLDA